MAPGTHPSRLWGGRPGGGHPGSIGTPSQKMTNRTVMSTGWTTQGTQERPSGRRWELCGADDRAVHPVRDLVGETHLGVDEPGVRQPVEVLAAR